MYVCMEQKRNGTEKDDESKEKTHACDTHPALKPTHELEKKKQINVHSEESFPLYALNYHHHIPYQHVSLREYQRQTFITDYQFSFHIIF